METEKQETLHLCVISHTHWDREWYLPYEKHHMLYIEMMDTLIDTMEKDKEYKWIYDACAVIGPKTCKAKESEKS